MAQTTKDEKRRAAPGSQNTPNLSDDEKRASLQQTPPAAARNGDETSGSSTVTNTPLVGDSNLERFNTITRRDAREQLAGPPELPFDLRHHKLSLSMFTFLALSECCFVPIALYYGLSKGTNMRSGRFPVTTTTSPKDLN